MKIIKNTLLNKINRQKKTRIKNILSFLLRNKTLNALLRFFYFFRSLIIKKPFIVEIDITDNCNLRCSHCYHFNGKEHFNFKEKNISEWEKIFLDFYNKGIRFIFIVGGEPTLRNDVLMLADSIFLFVDIITNGIKKVPNNFRRKIFVSIDGNRETNDKIRGKGSFDKIMLNYKDDKRVIINFTLQKNNYPELEDIVKISINSGFSGIVCNIYTETDMQKKSGNPLRINANTRKSIINELYRIEKEYPKHLLMSKNMIKWYQTADHNKYCYWRQLVLHYDTDMNKRKCFANADCSKCGCFAGTFDNIIINILNPLKMFRLFAK